MSGVISILDERILRMRALGRFPRHADRTKQNFGFSPWINPYLLGSIAICYLFYPQPNDRFLKLNITG
ncbi:MAG: hypothetical protein KME17_06700 [Cyanosarcina radialis HA8281-LM2]|nr:hypothetical protein [Cyanosarcina radialis HA8281-LM2]